MTIPTVSTYEIVGAPRRPTISDLGGAAFVDDQAYPPDPQTMPSAALENQNEFILAAVNQVTPVLRLTMRWTGAAYVIDNCQVVSTLVDPTTNGATFTVTRNSVGNVSITWPANTFPTPLGQAEAHFTLTALLYNATIGAQNITNGVQVFMTAGTSGAAAAAGSDQSFTVSVH